MGVCRGHAFFFSHNLDLKDGLEDELGGELKDPRMWAALFARDAAEGRTRHSGCKRISVSEGVDWVAKLRRVGEVEDFCTKAEACMLQGKHSLDGGVEAVLARAAHDADTAVAEVLVC